MSYYIFDIDGTISCQGEPVQPLLADRIVALTAQHQVIFASGRSIRDMLPMLPEKLHDCLMLGCNGGMAWQGGDFLFSHTFNKETIQIIISFLHEKKIPYLLDGQWHYATSKEPHYFHAYIRSLSTHQERSEDELIANGVTKILILNQQFVTTLRTFLQQHNIIHALHQYNDFNTFDIIPKDVSKYHGLVSLGIDLDDSIVFGNDENDFTMLAQAKIAVFTGIPERFTQANYYSSTAELPILLDNLENIN